MAKSVKKSPSKAVKRATGKSAIKKSAKKTVAKAAKKATKITSKKATPKKVVKKAPLKKTAKKTAGKSAPAKTTGKTFLIVYHAPLDALAQTANVSPEDQAAGMALWEAWAERVGSRLLDMGAPLMNGKRLSATGDQMPSTREVAGYSLLSADDWDEVMSLLEGHPHISGWHPEATIEIHEAMELPET